MKRHSLAPLVKAIQASHMTVLVETITPDTAKLLLDTLDPEQRNLRPIRVENFVALMKRGEFLLTHQGIAISDRGTLIDGQHRLQAIIDYGHPVRMCVARNVPHQTIRAIDGGAVRTSADRLHIAQNKIAIVNTILRCMTKTSSLTDGLRKQVWDVIEARVEELHAYAPTSAKTVTNAWIKSAVILWMAHPDAKGYVMDQYRAMSLSDYTSMSPRTAALYRQLVGGYNHNGRQIVPMFRDAMLRSWLGFDPALRGTGKISVKDQDLAVGRLLAQIKKQFPFLVSL